MVGYTSALSDEYFVVPTPFRALQNVSIQSLERDGLDRIETEKGLEVYMRLPPV